MFRSPCAGNFRVPVPADMSFPLYYIYRRKKTALTVNAVFAGYVSAEPFTRCCIRPSAPPGHTVPSGTPASSGPFPRSPGPGRRSAPFRTAAGACSCRPAVRQAPLRKSHPAVHFPVPPSVVYLHRRCDRPDICLYARAGETGSMIRAAVCDQPDLCCRNDRLPEGNSAPEAFFFSASGG